MTTLEYRKKTVCLLLLLIRFSLSGDSPVVVLQFDTILSQVNPLVHERLLYLLQKASQFPVMVVNSSEPIGSLASGSIVIAIGDTIITNKYINKSELASLGSEGFIVRSKLVDNYLILVTNGNPRSPNIEKIGINNGMLYGAYALLEELGFGFFHPLNATIPPIYVISQTTELNIVEKPYWGFRGFHYHSEHPLELTNFLNGWGPTGPYDNNGWQNTMIYFQNYAEWLGANRQNRLEFVILSADDWIDFVTSPLRQERFREIISVAHQWGVVVGADVALLERQQHAWHMTDAGKSVQEQTKDIQNVISWIFNATFDFVSSESGISEFTNPGCAEMLNLMNIATRYVKNFPNKEIFIKVHISSNQVCEDFVDPRTGKPLNFNYIPVYADPKLSILPHTVQLYRIDDPTASSYGNSNFSDMFNFTMFNANKRGVVWYPETAYWVNYDIDVPLFLPVYASARLYDLRAIAIAEKQTNSRVMGQMVFDSGWEWGYWLTDVVVAHAVWNPHMELSFDDALSLLFSHVTRIFGTNADKINTHLTTICQQEHNLLALGEVDSKLPPDIIERNGISYVEGWDTWADISRYTGLIITQPFRLNIEDMFLPWTWSKYSSEVQPLLAEMDQIFQALASLFGQLNVDIPPYTQSLFDELSDSMQVTSLRVTQVFGSYDSLWGVQTPNWNHQRLEDAIKALNTSLTIIRRREKFYRVPMEWIAGWNTINPTVYTYGYLWTVHSAYYFYRDILKVSTLDIDTLSPCFMNIISPIDVAFGEGIVFNVTGYLRDLFDKMHWEFIGDCLHAPKDEPVYRLPTIFDQEFD